MRNKNITQTIEMFRELVQEIDIRDMPIKYIAAACLTDEDGMENVITGDEIAALMERRPPYHEVEDVNFLLDLRTIAIDVSLEISRIFDRIAERFDKGEY